MAHEPVVLEETVTKLSPRSVSDTVARLTEMIAARGLRLFASLDQRAEAERVGLDLRETTLVLFGSPAAGTPIMAAAPLAALDLPLKLLIWAHDGQTKVSYTPWQAVAKRYGLSPDLAKNLTAIDALSDALVSS